MKPAIETFTGKHFSPLAPVFADIEIEDIAHALSNQCRFAGHTRVHYSVAEHSVRVSELLGKWGAGVSVQLWGLLHDASEAYLVDLPTPLKLHPTFGPIYVAVERDMMFAICRRFGLHTEEPESVRAADAILLATEVRDLMHPEKEYWSKLKGKPLPELIRPWGPGVAEYFFLRRFKELTGDARGTKGV